MLGRGGECSEIGRSEGFIGADFDINRDLAGRLPDNWREFNDEFIPVYLKAHPEKSRIAAGLACGALWVIGQGIKAGDIVLSPNGSGSYLVGEVTGGYFYAAGQILPHRRPVRWFTQTLARAEMSEGLRNSSGSIGTVSNITKHGEEIAMLIGETAAPELIATDTTVEDPTIFALEKHLEDFLVHNWKQTELGKNYDIFEDEGELAGQQYPSDTGPIDILAVRKDKKELLVVELKKGRASDSVIGQIQRYMGYVLEELAEEGQTVRGVIIALDDDLRIQRALKVATNIDFYRYKVSFSLFKA